MRPQRLPVLIWVWEVEAGGCADPGLGERGVGYGDGRRFHSSYTLPGGSPLQLWPGVPPFFDAARSVRWRLRVKARGLLRGREGRAGAQTAAPSRAQRALHRTFSRSRPELEARTMVSGSRTASENLVTLIPVRKVRRSREAMESPEETLTLLKSPYAEQSSAKSLSKGFPEPPSPPRPPYLGGALEMGTK